MRAFAFWTTASFLLVASEKTLPIEENERIKNEISRFCLSLLSEVDHLFVLQYYAADVPQRNVALYSVHVV